MLFQFKSITTFIFDMDGVLTDGSLTLLPSGEMVRKMNVKDGYALQLAVKKGYHIAVISGGNSAEAMDRLKRLGIDDVWMKVTDKIGVANQYLQNKNINWSNVLYMGDDLPDLDVMKQAALPCCPADAVQEIKDISTYISHLSGGVGCVRDVVEKIMKLRGDWNSDTHIPSI